MGILVGWAYLVSDGFAYFDTRSLIITELLFLLLFWSTFKFTDKHPLALVVTFVISVQIGVRLVSLFFQPDWIFGFGAPGLNATVFSQLLAYIFLGTAACFCGIVAGDWFAKGMVVARERSPTYLPFAPLKTVFMLFLGLHYFNFIVFGYAGASGSGENLNVFTRYVLRVLDPMMVFFMLMTSYYWVDRRNSSSKRWMYFMWVCSFAYTTLIGGRGGYYELLVMMLNVGSVFTLPLRIRVSPRNAVLGIMALLATPFLFEYSTKVRVTQWYSPTIASEFGNQTEVIKGIFQRISLVEQTLHPMFAKEMGYNDISDLVNIKTTVQSTLNRLIPGRPFGEILFSEFAFGFLYKKEGALVGRVGDRIDYVGYEWGMYAISYQLFGYFGGLFFIFFFTALISFGVTALLRLSTFRSYCLAVLLSFTTYVWVRNLGLDNLIDRVCHSGVVMLCLLWVFSFIFGQSQSIRASIRPLGENQWI